MRGRGERSRKKKMNKNKRRRYFYSRIPTDRTANSTAWLHIYYKYEYRLQ
jgi:hypothetical protein